MECVTALCGPKSDWVRGRMGQVLLRPAEIAFLCRLGRFASWHWPASVFRRDKDID